jgi:hypothetical protein
MKKVDSLKVYLPDVRYVFTPKEILQFLQDVGVGETLGKPGSQHEVAKMLTRLETYARYDLQTTNPKKVGVLKKERKTVESKFDQKTIRAPFLIDGKTYTYFRILIAPSTIPEAGLGAYAMDEIPRGARDTYIGEFASKSNVNSYYSWEILPYNKNGVQKVGDPIGYADAENPEKASWTRYANCGLTKRSNNLEVDQLYDKILYKTTRTIKQGEELFIDYGFDYRRDNLHMRGPY